VSEDRRARAQALHALIVICKDLDIKDGVEAKIIEDAQAYMGVSPSHRNDASKHVEKSYDGGSWGGHRSSVIQRSKSRIEDAIENEYLPDTEHLGQGLLRLLSKIEELSFTEEFDEDDDENLLSILLPEGGVAEIGMTGSDLLDSLIDDDDIDPPPLDETTFVKSVAIEPTVSEDVIEVPADDDPPIPELPLAKAASLKNEDELKFNGERALQTYRLLLETVWVDDVLDPAEIELLARKRKQLGIDFETHLSLTRAMMGADD